jgi:TonB family protein
MFETVVATPSPPRSLWAGPAAGLGHGLLLAGALLAALWAPEDLLSPVPPIEPHVIPTYVVSLGNRGSSGDERRAEHRKQSRETGARTSPKEAFPTRVPDAAAAESPTDVEPPATDVGSELGPDGPGGEPNGCLACRLPGDVGDGAVSIGERGLAPPLLVLRIEPSYPPAMIRVREEGVVAVEAIIGKDGSIEDASIVTATNGLFEAEALRAVRQWRYRPGMLDGRPVRVRLLVTVTFRLR